MYISKSNVSKIVLTLSLFFLIISCKQNKLKSESEIYTEKSIKLINDILKDRQDTCRCLLEPPNKPTLQEFDYLPHFNYKEYIAEVFNFESESDIEMLHGIHETLILKANHLPSNIKLINQKEWNSIFLKYGVNARDTIIKRYPKLCYLTKPIFDKNYKIAIMDIDLGGCLWSPPYRLHLDNGKWKYD